MACLSRAWQDAFSLRMDTEEQRPFLSMFGDTKGLGTPEGWRHHVVGLYRNDGGELFSS